MPVSRKKIENPSPTGFPLASNIPLGSSRESRGSATRRLNSAAMIYLQVWWTRDEKNAQLFRRYVAQRREGRDGESRRRESWRPTGAHARRRCARKSARPISARPNEAAAFRNCPQRVPRRLDPNCGSWIGLCLVSETYFAEKVCP